MGRKVNPEIYSKIVANRPELDIALLSTDFKRWMYAHDWIDEDVAHALIESHWLRKLDPHQAVLKFGAGFGVGKMLEKCVYELTTHIHETPLAALTEHFSKEKA